MKKFLKFLFSMQLMGISIMLFAVIIAIGTFVENDFGTPVAKSLIYNSWYLELLYVIIGINLIANIRRFKLYKKEKWSMGLFHVSFIVILLGAAVTRYVGFEGNMHIREGELVNQMSTVDSYMKVDIKNSDSHVADEKKMVLKIMGFPGFKKTYDLKNSEITVNLKQSVLNADYKLEINTDGKPMIDFITIGKNSSKGMNYAHLSMGEKQNVDGYSFSFTNEDADVMFAYTDALRIKSRFEITLSDMMGEEKQNLEANKWHSVNLQNIYDIKGTKLVVKQFYKNAKYVFVKGNKKENLHAFVFDITKNNITKELIVRGKQNFIVEPASLIIDNTVVSISYGPKFIKLPFSIKLNKFVLDRYPGSMSPSSFLSDVTLIDKELNINEKHSIFMNNILKHRGYRFFQASYDTDEKGTFLSVNNDIWGMRISYLGYFLMILGMFSSLFRKNTNFSRLSNKASKSAISNSIKTIAIIMLLSVSSITSFAQGSDNMPIVSQKQADMFGRLLVQDNGGRFEPLNTLSSELIRKICKKSSINSYNSDQILLSMLVYPDQYQLMNMIKVSNKKLAAEIGCDKYASFSQFFDKDRTYMLSAAVRRAYAQEDSKRSKYDKEVIAVDERVNIYYMIMSGDALKLFPDIKDDMKEWNTSKSKLNFSGSDSLFVKNAVTILTRAIAVGNHKTSTEIMRGISKFQYKYGGSHLPSIEKQEVEIIYNNFNIFKKLFPIYLLMGFLLLVLLIIQLLKPNFKLTWFLRSIFAILLVGFTLHTINLAARWYICGHAPWSNGFESMTYVAWAALLAGFFFSRKSYFALAASSLIAGLTLFVAHLSWMNPEVTNLVPVLKSYWLTIHVAIITSSYGFLALSTILGFINMILYILTNKENKSRLKDSISNLSSLNEMSMTVGIYFLATGTILGGIWANESWGRYWGWDPKETWALISVLVYSFVLHLRFLPNMKSTFTFNAASILAYSSILMTYFGVNYYLSGLHSYAQGDPIPIPTWVYYAIVSVFVLLISAYIRYRKNNYMK